MSEREINCEIPDRPTDSNLKLDDFVPQWQSEKGKSFSGKPFAVDKNISNMDLESSITLTLPQAIYGITGEECRIFVENLYLLHDKNLVNIKIICPVGIFDGKWWRYTAGQPGVHPMSVEAYDRAGRLVGQAETQIVIADAKNGNDENISMLMIGDSLFAGAQCANSLLKNMREHGNANFYLMGSHAGRGASLELGKAAVEAYGGWRWAHFIEKFEDGDTYNCKSKFIRLMPDGSKKLDFAGYLEKYHMGKAPDVIVILLGCNDIAHASMDDYTDWLADSKRYRKQLLDHLRACAPDAVIGLVTLPPANGRNKAYLDNYHGVVVHQQYRFNQLNYVRELMLDYQNDPDYSIIPIFPSIDPFADYPEDNSIHPNDQGYGNFAKVIEAWLKAMY